MSFRLEGRVVFFATNNINKFHEARAVLNEYRIATGMLRVKTLEIQSDDLQEIAETSVIEAFGKCNLPVIVEDAGLFIEALKGFPGPYAAYVYKTVGNEGLLQLMRNVEDRRANFQSAIAYCSSEKRVPICFTGKTAGEITRKARTGDGKSGFGFDPIFRPAKSRRTFAEMSTTEKNECSHRAKALRRFAEWYERLVSRKI
jgi:XTP/dITP diphosphohydrolase